MNQSTLKRLSCPVCYRAQTACICQWVKPIKNEIEVLILQHPLEVAQAKGTARLLHLCLANSTMLTGEVFEEALFKTNKYSVLLYPATIPDPSLGVIEAPALEPQHLLDPKQVRLVVMDGTWRKSRKMLYLNPALQKMPRLALSNLPPSKYLIRKAQQAHQLSTLEATCYGLTQMNAASIGIEASTKIYEPLIAAMDGFVGQQLGCRGL